MLPVVRGDARRRGRSSSTRSCWSRYARCRRLLARPGLRRGRGRARRGLPRVAWQLRREPTRRARGVLFHYSLLYLALLFVAAALDPVLL